MPRIIQVIFILNLALLFGCHEDEDHTPFVKQSMLDSSFVTIKTATGILFNTHFHPCEVLGYTSTWINHPDTSLYQPIVAMPSPFDLNSAFLFNIYFKNTDIPIDSDPGIVELQSMLDKTLELGFNEDPHVGDIIFYVQQDGKRYSNSWDPESVGLASPPYIRDRTGLKVEVIGYELVQNDCRESGPFPAIRLAIDVEGFLVTSNQKDSLWIEGKLDFLMSTSVF